MFTVCEANEIVIDKTFISYGIVDFRAFVSRVNKDFDSVKKKTERIEIRYPVECSMINGIHAVPWNGEAPFAFKIFNRSFKEIGMETANN